LNLKFPAIFSPCRTWRYTLHREWWSEDHHRVAFIGLNPSTADEVQDDPTVRRCIGFAKRWGYGGMFMLNIFGLRGMNPKVLYRAADPVGPENDRYILEVIRHPGTIRVVTCWGNHGILRNRGQEVIRLIQEAPGLHRLPEFRLSRLGELTKRGQPRHPLYLKGSLTPTRL
jgi:hypothetical protein